TIRQEYNQKDQERRDSKHPLEHFVSFSFSLNAGGSFPFPGLRPVNHNQLPWTRAAEPRKYRLTRLIAHGLCLPELHPAGFDVGVEFIEQSKINFGDFIRLAS
ncbi:MAG: hypothetical protein L0Z53_25455, partial [Acidobacteriales bacterium]|nr:hypothetical protein [Terriglobales bacterium]